MTNPDRPNISDAELETLKALWTLERATVRELLEALRVQGKSWAYTTVQTLLQRLEEKGYVTSDKSGRAHQFRALVSRRDLVGARIDELVDRVCDGAVSPLVLSLVQKRKFGPDEIEAFRDLLNQMESEETSDPTEHDAASKRSRRRDERRK
ncbi:MAG: BlaI/MecI/CopY family transcriptional regulator [Phycisphaerales bacterium]